MGRSRKEQRHSHKKSPKQGQKIPRSNQLQVTPHTPTFLYLTLSKRGQYDWTALHFAVNEEATEAIVELLKQGSSVNSRT